MRPIWFKIHNFKGIKQATIDLSRNPTSRVWTLVGLNESGKTTVLEAINSIMYTRESLDALDISGVKITDPHHIIPKGRQENFTDEVSVEAAFELDENDQKTTRELLLKRYRYQTMSIGKTLEIHHIHEFSDSRFKSESVGWSLPLQVRKKGSKKIVSLDNDDEEWQQVADALEARLPSIFYFPSALFDFPSKIDLTDRTGVDPKELSKHRFYRSLIQDILDSLDNELVLEKHVVARAKSVLESDRRALRKLLLGMSNSVSKTVFEAWNEIFRRQVAAKKIVFNVEIDSEGVPSLTVNIEDGNSEYSLGERSLGFRWFFVFLLMTTYRGLRRRGSNGVLFLLDEPASNLHPSAQSLVLESFERLHDSSRIIYTTHSHHLVNPRWLESTFVVRNEAVDYEGDDDFAARDTAISVSTYRDFSSRHPTKTTYFQPILDVLDYQPSRLDNIPDVAILEGKNDFYCLNYIQECAGLGVPHIRMLPGAGSGSIDSVIQLYTAWGRNFVILLDADVAGEREKSRYMTKFGELVKDRIFTLADIDASFATLELEELFEPTDQLSIIQSVYPQQATFDKKIFNRAIQECWIRRLSVTLVPESVKRLTIVLAFLGQAIANASGRPPVKS